MKDRSNWRNRIAISLSNAAMKASMGPSPVTGVFLVLLLTSSSASVAPTRQGCVHELVAISPCLSYISSSPNNASVTVPGECCDAFSGIFRSGTALCLCYFLWQPLLLGFPLNSTRLLSLPSVCPQPFVHASSTYFQSLCSDSSASPSGSDSGLGIRGPGFGDDPSPDMGLAPETNGRSSTLPDSSMDPRRSGGSSATTHFCNGCSSCLLLHVIVIFILVSMFLV